MYNHYLLEDKQEEFLRKNQNKIYQVSGIPKNTLKIVRTIHSSQNFTNNSNYPKGLLSLSRIKENLF